MITRDRADQIAAQLATAGTGWQEVAATIPEVLGISAETDHTYAYVTLTERVVSGGIAHRGLIFLRTETQQWQSIGWSAAWDGVEVKPSGWIFDADAGVHAPMDEV